MPRQVRTISDEELSNVAGLLDGLARRFALLARSFLAPEADRVVVGDLRSQMALAGRHLLVLLHFDILDSPASPPAWLSLSLHRFGRRPSFNGVLDNSDLGPSRTSFEPIPLAKLVRKLIEDREPLDSQRPGRKGEVSPTLFRRRQVFLEACIGWLGTKLGLETKVTPPTVSVFPCRQIGVVDAPLTLVLDLFRGAASEERPLFSDISRLCAEASRALAGETNRLAAELRQSRVPVDAIQLPLVATSTFYELTVAFLAELRSIVRFRTLPQGHSDWPGLVAHIPQDLLNSSEQLKSARHVLSERQHYLEQATEGVLYGGWIDEFSRDPAAARRALEEEVEQARTWVAGATRREETAVHERRKFEAALVDAWLAKHRERFASLHADFSARVRRLAMHVDGVSTAGYSLGEWRGTSGCDVLMQVADDLAKLFSIESDDGAYLHVTDLTEALTSISNDDWCSLDIAVRREAAQLVRDERSADDGSDAPDNRSGAVAEQPVGTPDKESPPGFFRDGDGWTIEFGGRRVVVKNCLGMGYIQSLLAKPGVPIPATELDGLEPGMASSEQPVIDAQELRETRNRLGEIDEELREHGGPLTSEERDQLAREKTNLLGNLSATASGQRVRTTKSPQSAARERVRSAIRRALDAIGKQHETLLQHLKASQIGSGGAARCYRPGSPTTWRVNA